MVQEIALENAISSTAQYFGVSSGLSDMLGEALSGAFESVISVDKIYGDSDAKPQLPSTVEAMTSHTSQTSSQRINGRAQIRNFIQSSKAKLINTLKTKIMASNTYSSLASLRTDTIMISAINNIMNQKMGSNIDQNQVVKNFENMQIKKFPALIMADVNFRSNVETAVWDTITSGGTVQDFLNNEVFQEAWGLLDENGDQTREMYFEVVKKGQGTVYYKQDGSVYEKVNGEFVKKTEYGTMTLAELFLDADAINLVDPEISSLYTLRKDPKRHKNKNLIQRIHSVLRNRREYPLGLIEELKNTLTSYSLISDKVKECAEGVLRLSDPDIPFYTYTDWGDVDSRLYNSREIEILHDRLTNLLADSPHLSQKFLMNVLSISMKITEITNNYLSRTLRQQLKHNNVLNEVAIVTNRVKDMCKYLAQLYFIADISTTKLLTVYGNKNVHISVIDDALNIDQMIIMLKEKHTSTDSATQVIINDIINIEVNNFHRNVIRRANSLQDANGFVHIDIINEFISDQHLESHIQAAILSKLSTSELSVLKRKYVAQLLTANSYEIHSIEGDAWGKNHWTRARTVLDRGKIPSRSKDRLKVFIDKDSKNPRNTIYHIRLDVKMDSEIVRLNIRAKSAIEMRTFVNTLKAYDRNLGAGGFIKNIFADNFFSRLKKNVLGEPKLVIDTIKYRIFIRNDRGKIIKSYEVAELNDFMSHSDFERGSINDAGTILTVGGREHYIITDVKVAPLDLAVIFSNPSDGLGFIVEILGMGEWETRTDIYGKIVAKAYGLIKDYHCLLNIFQGMVPVYVAEGAKYTFYKNSPNIEHIGNKAPLLTSHQYGMLMTALGFAGIDVQDLSNPSQIPLFEDIMRDLSLHPEKYGFLESDAGVLSKIQEAFGFQLNDQHEVIGINSAMVPWWFNFHNSRNENTILSNDYQHFLDLLSDEEDVSKFIASYFYQLPRS